MMHPIVRLLQSRGLHGVGVGRKQGRVCEGISDLVVVPEAGVLLRCGVGDGRGGERLMKGGLRLMRR